VKGFNRRFFCAGTGGGIRQVRITGLIRRNRGQRSTCTDTALFLDMEILMHRKSTIVCAMIAAIGLALGASSASRAETIMKVNLSGSSASFGFNSGVLSTLDDGASSSNGDREASIEYLGFLDSLAPTATTFFAFAPTPSQSISLSGLTASTPSTTYSGSLMVQDFTSGNLAIFDSTNSLLLSAEVDLGAVTGPLGLANPQALFLAFGSVTGGSLAKYIEPDSLRLKMKLPTVSNGFSVSPAPAAPAPPTHAAALQPFTASTWLIEIQANQAVVPEPAGTIFAAVWGVLLSVLTARVRR